MDEALQTAHAALAGARERLETAAARDELLAEWVTRRFRTGTFVRIDRVWRLGELLLGRGGGLYATGASIRIDELRHDNHQSNLAAERRALRAAALAAKIPAGETLDYDAEPIALDAGLTESAGPVILTADGVMVRWSPRGAELVPFESYLHERVELLIETDHAVGHEVRDRHAHPGRRGRPPGARRAPHHRRDGRFRGADLAGRAVLPRRRGRGSLAGSLAALAA